MVSGRERPGYPLAELRRLSAPAVEPVGVNAIARAVRNRTGVEPAIVEQCDAGECEEEVKPASLDVVLAAVEHAQAGVAQAGRALRAVHANLTAAEIPGRGHGLPSGPDGRVRRRLPGRDVSGLVPKDDVVEDDVVVDEDVRRWRRVT